jgi:quinolinate synthase
MTAARNSIGHPGRAVEVKVEEGIASRARRAIDRMMENVG